MFSHRYMKNIFKFPSHVYNVFWATISYKYHKNNRCVWEIKTKYDVSKKQIMTFMTFKSILTQLFSSQIHRTIVLKYLIYNQYAYVPKVLPNLNPICKRTRLFGHTHKKINKYQGCIKSVCWHNYMLNIWIFWCCLIRINQPPKNEETT